MNTKVELASSLEEALLKGCLWMSSGSGEDSEGERDEASQQPTLWHQLCSAAKTYGEEKSSKFYYS